MRNCLVCATIVGALACALLRGDDASARAWRELFDQPEPVAAVKHVAAVLAACGNDADRLKAMISADAAYEPFAPGWLRRTTKVLDGATPYETEFLVRVPRGYTPERSWPLVLAAHGQHGNGAWAGSMTEGLLGQAVERYVVVAPTMPGPAHYNGKSYQEQAYLKPMDWARLRLNVDDDRLYVTGYSQGGHCSWHLATMFPRLFAAAVPMAGVPAFEGTPYTSYVYLENLAHLPVWAIWGEKDTAPPPALGNVDVSRAAAERLKKLGNANFNGTELPGVGHGGCFPKRGELDKYLQPLARVLAPQKVVHVFHLPHHGRAYYLEAISLARPPMSFDKPIRVEVPAEGGRTPAREEVLEAAQKILARNLFRLWAELDAAANALTVRADGVRTLRLYVLEGMFDLSKPVTIRFWDRSWSGKVPRSARCMLVNYAACRDATGLVCNEIDLDVSGKATVRFP